MRSFLPSFVFLLLGSLPAAAMANEHAFETHSSRIHKIDALAIGGPASNEYQESFEFGPAAATPDASAFGLAMATWIDSTTGTKWAVIGAPNEDARKGAAYVFALYPQSKVWHQQARLTASNAAENDQFGYSVSIDNGFIAIGAPWASVHGTPGAGAAYVFAYDSSAEVWQQQDEVVGAVEPYNHTGASVAIRRDTLAIGSPWAFGFVGSVFMAERSGTAWVYTKAITPPDGFIGNDFGTSIALHDSGVLIGMPVVDRATSGSSAYRGVVFMYSKAGTDWTFSNSFEADDGSDYNDFGYAVAWNGSQIAIGSPKLSNSKGGVFTYFNGTSGWEKTAFIAPSDSQEGDQFGQSVAFGNSILAAGAPRPGSTGSTYLFRASGDSWMQDSEIASPDTGDTKFFHQGAAIALAGDQLLVGDPDAVYSRVDGGLSGQGAALAYPLEAPNNEAPTLLHPSRTDFPGFGSALALSSDTLIVSSLNEKDSASNRGIASVFARTTGGRWTWQTDFSQPSYGPLLHLFDCSTLATDGTTAIIGSPAESVGAHASQGIAYVERRPSSSTSGWAQEAALQDLSGSSSDYFGCAVALSGDTAFVGAPIWSGGPGKVYVFQRMGTKWALQKQLSASDAAPGDLFGISIAISNNQLLIGAPGNNGAYLFVRSGTDWKQSKKIAPADVKTGDLFGASVAIDGSTIAVRSATKDETYIFGGSTWAPQQHIDSPIPGFSDGSIRLQGNRLVIASQTRQSIDVYKKWAGSWKLASNFSSDSWHGYLSAALSGPELVVSRTTDGGGGGRAYLLDDDQLFADGFGD